MSRCTHIGVEMTDKTAPVFDKPVFSHSQLSSWRGCQQAWHYHYEQHLAPKRIERPLHLGSWVHACLESFYKTGSWREGHASYLAQYNKMLPEERFRLDKGKSKKQSENPADYEPLPSQVERIVRSYIWYYSNAKSPSRKNEKTIAVEVPFWLDRGDYILHGVIDRIYEDLDNGIVVVQDHKVWSELPDESAFHTMDPQLTYYLRGATEALGVQAQAVEYNYAVSAPPGFPSQNKDGSLSKQAVATDYPTFYRWLKEHGFDPAEYSEVLAPLYRQSPFLKRLRLTRNDAVTDKILLDVDATVRDILNHTHTVRSIDRGCTYCPYVAMCRAELFGLDTAYIRKSQFMTDAEKKRMDKLRGR